ncbi:transposase family protein [Leisingera sp. HS039]|nr:transposase family protein [Leisingera sp. HS039]
MDFLSDQLFDGRKIRILTIVDTHSKVSPAIDVRPRYTGADVVRTLEHVTQTYGRPGSIRVDQGPEFISKDLDLWAYLNGVALGFSRPGKPTDNAFAEAFNGKVRAECIDQNWFLPVKMKAAGHSPDGGFHNQFLRVTCLAFSGKFLTSAGPGSGARAISKNKKRAAPRHRPMLLMRFKGFYSAETAIGPDAVVQVVKVGEEHLGVLGPKRFELESGQSSADWDAGFL